MQAPFQRAAKAPGAGPVTVSGDNTVGLSTRDFDPPLPGQRTRPGSTPPDTLGDLGSCGHLVVLRDDGFGLFEPDLAFDRRLPGSPYGIALVSPTGRRLIAGDLLYDLVSGHSHEVGRGHWFYRNQNGEEGVFSYASDSGGALARWDDRGLGYGQGDP